MIETVASAPSFNAYRASLGAARRLVQRGFGPVAHVCHPPAFQGYATDESNIPLTFAGQLILALSCGVDFTVAVHHARSAPMRLMGESTKGVFGFPGYYWPLPRSDAARGSAGPTISQSQAGQGVSISSSRTS